MCLRSAAVSVLNNDSFDSGCNLIHPIDVEGSRIGNNNIIEARGKLSFLSITSRDYWHCSVARVLGSTTIGNNCVIGAACSTESNETITDLTVIYGAESKRRQQSEVLPVSKQIYISYLTSADLTFLLTCMQGQRTLHARHLEYLWEVIAQNFKYSL